jgi:hypothetical protein
MLVIGGTTPSLTIGDAGTEDTKIVFDGNAQDFHIGLDDSADDLVIGLGSSLGTTTHMAFDEAGHITMPLQSAFMAISNAENNETGNGTEYTMLWAKTEVIDQNADFTSATGIFTAPVTGSYAFGCQLMINSGGGMSAGNIKLVTSNRTYNRSTGTEGADNSYSQLLHQFADMDASDTAKITITIEGIGADTADMGVDSSFWGYLVC